jgi:hypothetical protein
LPTNYNDLFHPDMGKGLLLDSAMTNTNNKDVNWLVWMMMKIVSEKGIFL